MLRSFRSAPRGRRVPCSQLRTVFALTLRNRAKSTWLALSDCRISQIIATTYLARCRGQLRHTKVNRLATFEGKRTQSNPRRLVKHLPFCFFLALCLYFHGSVRSCFDRIRQPPIEKALCQALDGTSDGY